MSPRRDSARPYYSSYAWAYDQLNERPVAHECAYVAASSLGGASPRMLACSMPAGTGRYAVELARRGDRVTGVDASPALLEVANNIPEPRRSCSSRLIS